MFDWLKKTFGGGDEPEPTREPTLMTLRPGDVVIHFDVTYVVKQRITYHEQGFFWFDYRLDDGAGQSAWLSVADDDVLELAFYKPVDIDLPMPPPSSFEWDGTRFAVDEASNVDAQIDRGTGSETRTTVDSWDFEGSDGRLISIQRWGAGEVEIAVGNPVQPVELDLLPGSDE